MPPRIGAAAHAVGRRSISIPASHIVQARPARPTTAHESPLPHCGRGMLGFDIACQRREARMPAYFVAEVEVTNPAGYEPYRALAGASIAQYGGRFVARGGKAELIEGEPEPKRIVILEF